MANPLAQAHRGVSLYGRAPTPYRRPDPDEQRRLLLEQARQRAAVEPSTGPTPANEAFARFQAGVQEGRYGGLPTAEEEGGGNAFGRGLGFVVNNPLTRNALRPLEVLDLLRRGSILGTEYGARALPEWAEWALPILKAVDEDKVRSDERSAWDKFTDPEYGFGQITGDTGNKWVDRGIGLAGDLALDPLTYLTFGAAPLAKGVAVSGRTARAALMADAAKAARASGRLTPEYVDKLRKVGQRGYGAADDAMRADMGLRQSAARLTLPFSSKTGVTVPGTKHLATGINKATGVARGRLNATERGQRFAKLRTPKAIDDAMPIITNAIDDAMPIITNAKKGSADDFLAALETVRFDNFRRQGQGVFKSLGARELVQRQKGIAEELRTTYGNDMARYLEATEIGEEVTKLNELTDRLVQVAKEGSGVDIPELSEMGYLPHMLSTEFRELLQQNPEKAKLFERQAGLLTENTLADSGFLQRRAFRPGTTIKIGDDEITLATGSIKEINEKVAKLFPDLKGTALETDPMTMLERYIDSVAEDVGNRFASKQMLEEGSPFLYKDDGTLGKRLVQTEGNPKPLNDNPLYRAVKDDSATDALNADLAARMDERAEFALGQGDILRREVAYGADEIRESIHPRLVRGAKTLKSKVDDATRKMEEINRTTNSLAQRKRRTRELAKQTIADLDAQIKHVNRRMGAVRREVGKKAEREKVDVVRKLNDEMHDLMDEADRLNTWFDTGIVTEFAEVKAVYADMLKELRRAQDDMARTMDEVVGRAPLTDVSKMSNTERAQYIRKTQRMEPGPQRDIQAPLRPEKPMQPEYERTRLAQREVSEAELAAERIPLTQGDLAELQNRLKAKGITRNLDQNFVKRLFPEMTTDDLSKRVSKMEFLRRYKESLRNASKKPASRYKEVSDELEAVQSALGQALRGGGDVGRIAADLPAREAKALHDLALPDQLEALERVRNGIPIEAQQKMDAIEAQLSFSKKEYAELRDNRAMLQAKREELRRAAKASPDSPRKKLEDSDLTKNDPDVEVLRFRSGAGADTPLTPDPNLIGPPAPLRMRQPLDRIITEIEQMVKLNPDMDDRVLRHTEALLHQYHEALEKATKWDIRFARAERAFKHANKGEMATVYVAALRDNLHLLDDGSTIMREEMHRLLQNVTREAGDPTLLGRTFEQFTNFFKTYATLSPGFHIRNAYSAVFMNLADGVPLRRVNSGRAMWKKFIKEAYKDDGDVLGFYLALDDDWRNAFDAVFASGAGGRFFESGVAESTAIRRRKWKEKVYRNKATLKSQAAGQRVEGAVRLGMAYDTIKNGGDTSRALDRISRIHFDYAQVSEFDEKAKRLIPFWTFMSRNLPMQITEMWHKPRLYNQFNSVVRNLKFEPPEFTPDYILEGGGFDTGFETPGGWPGMGEDMPIFFQPDFAHTRVQEDIEKLLNIQKNPGRVFSDFNPMLTAPVEYMTGRNLFTGRQYQEADKRKLSGPIDWGMFLPYLATRQLDFGGKDGVYVSEKGEDFFRSINPLQDRISRLAPGAAGGKAGDRTLESMLRFLGAPIRTISDDQRRNEMLSRYYDQLDQRDLQRVLQGG